MPPKSSSPVSRISVADVRKAAEDVVSVLPPFWREFRGRQLARVSEEISWIYSREGTVVDLGGSSGFHASICVKLGMKAFCVDNFKVRKKGHISDHYYEHDLQAERVASELGVKFIHADMLDWEPPFLKSSIDGVMSFDNIEHLHHSPRGLYARIVECLKPGGAFLLGAPNAANILKRLRVPLGKNIYSPMEEWYMHEQFIGHVREPVVEDLLFIAKDLGLSSPCIMGRNWLGYCKLPERFKTYARILDGALRLFPSLCSDIYLLSQKRKESEIKQGPSSLEKVPK